MIISRQINIHVRSYCLFSFISYVHSAIPSLKFNIIIIIVGCLNFPIHNNNIIFNVIINVYKSFVVVCLFVCLLFCFLPALLSV